MSLVPSSESASAASEPIGPPRVAATSDVPPTDELAKKPQPRPHSPKLSEDFAPELSRAPTWRSALYDRRNIIGSAAAGMAVVVMAGILLPRRDTSLTMASQAVAEQVPPVPTPMVLTPSTPVPRSEGTTPPSLSTPSASSSPPVTPPVDVKPAIPPGNDSAATPSARRPSTNMSPTPLPVPFGAPVRFRSDLWNLPDEPLLGFVEIPAGPFTMGSDRRQDPAANNDHQQGTVTLGRFYIGRYEVTVGQMRAFAQGGGKVSADSLKGGADLPAANLTWHVAVAYTNWLDERLRQSSAVPSAVRSILNAGNSCRVALPSEAEWEKAARGTDGRIYPWGATLDHSKANYGGGGTKSVGSFPAGASPYGILDMGGNVEEWTRSLFQPSPYILNDPTREDLTTDGLRVVRGGSFSSIDSGLRAAFPSFDRPGGQLDRLGFRVVVSCF